MKSNLKNNLGRFLLANLAVVTIILGSLSFTHGMILASLAVLSALSFILLYKYMDASDRMIKAYANDKKVFSYLFDKANVGWGIFDVSGNLVQSGKHFKKMISNLSSEEELEYFAWPTLAEVLNLSNMYDLSSLNEGNHEIPISINRSGMLPEDVTLKISKCNKTNKILAILHKEPNTPPMTLPVEKKVHQITVVQKNDVNVNTIIEEAVEELSSFIQANNLMINIQAESEHVINGNPAEIKNSVTKLIRDVGNYLCTSGGKRKMDILVYSEDEKSIVSFMLYNNPVNSESVNLNIGTNEETWTLDHTLDRFEKDFSDFNGEVSLHNNFDQDKNFLFANLNFQLHTESSSHR